MSILTPRRALAMAILASFSLQVFAAEKVSRAEDREEVAVTIYNDSLALIKEVRRIPFDRGANSIALRDVSAKMRPETASLRALSGGSLRLIEQNFDFDLLTPQKLLEKYVGRSVTVIRTNPATGAETREPAEVLATNGNAALGGRPTKRKFAPSLACASANAQRTMMPEARASARAASSPASGR